MIIEWALKRAIGPLSDHSVRGAVRGAGRCGARREPS